MSPDLFKSRDELDLTSGSIGRPLFYLALPIVVTNLLQTAYNLADTFWVGQLNTDALAAISFAFPLVFLFISMGLGIAVAGSVLVAQHIGGEEEREAEFAASQTVSLSIILAAALGTVGYFIVHDLLGLLGAEPGVLGPATDYMQVIAIGLPFMFGFLVFISLMRGYGDTITPMLVMLGSVVLNILIDPVFIFGFESNPLFSMLGMGGLESTLYGVTGYGGSGVEGAAVATVLCRGLAFVVGIGIMFRGKRGVRIRVSELRPQLSFLRRLLEIGLPASVENMGRSLSVNVLLALIGTFATPVVAGYGIAVRVFSVIFLPAVAVGQGVETMTGQNVGAGEYDRVKQVNRIAATTMFLALSALGAFVYVFAEGIVGVFVGADPNRAQVIAVGVDFLRTVAPTFGFIGVVRVYTGGFRGTGKTITAALIAVGMLGVIRLPVAYVAAIPLGFASSGVWYAFAISNVLGGLIAFGWFQRGTWRGASLTDERGPGGTGEEEPPAADGESEVGADD
jgi:putative MATE family efflux protein